MSIKYFFIYIRNGIFHNQRALAYAIKKLDLVTRNDLDNDDHGSELFSIYMKYIYPTLKYMASKKLNKIISAQKIQDQGLRDLVNQNYGLAKYKKSYYGDFSEINKENFAHTLNYTLADVEYADFSIDEIKTIYTDDLDNVSMSGHIQDYGTIQTQFNRIYQCLYRHAQAYIDKQIYNFIDLFHNF